MRKSLLFVSALLLLGCSKSDDDFAEEKNEEKIENVKKFQFVVKGDFDAATFTRAYLQADGQSMTDLWVFDYVGGECVQSVHQTASDADWGVPSLNLTYGSHHVYFVASRGEGATLDADGHTLIWDGPRDTFWKDYQVDVVSTSNGNRAVTLDRVATKVRIVVKDKVPEDCKAVNVTPDRWYYGWDYVNGIAVAAEKKTRTIEVPASYIGTTGSLSMSVFGLSGGNEWTTNLSITATNDAGSVIGSASIVGAPFKANRSTEYSGNLFGSSGGFDVNVSEDWENPVVRTW